MIPENQGMHMNDVYRINAGGDKADQLSDKSVCGHVPERIFTEQEQTYDFSENQRRGVGQQQIAEVWKPNSGNQKLIRQMDKGKQEVAQKPETGMYFCRGGMQAEVSANQIQNDHPGKMMTGGDPQNIISQGYCRYDTKDQEQCGKQKMELVLREGADHQIQNRGNQHHHE